MNSRYLVHIKQYIYAAKPLENVEQRLPAIIHRSNNKVMYKTLAMIVVILVVASCKHDAPEVYDPSGQDTDGISLQLNYLPTGLPGPFNAIYFTDVNNGYLAGYNGAVCHTTDGGLSWQKQATPTGVPLYCIYFLDSLEGFAVGGESECAGGGCVVRGAVMLHTKDGGANWEKILLPATQKIALTSICFATESTGFAVGGHSIFITHDRGHSWKETILSELNGTMVDVEFADALTGLISCSQGKMARTVDGGLHWTITIPFDETQWYKLSKVDAHTIFIAGQSYIGKSENFGESWAGLPANPGPIYTLHFNTALEGYTFGMGYYSGGDFGHNYGSIYYTSDGGATWTVNNKLTKMTLIVASCFPTPDVGYAIGDNVVMKIKKIND